MFKKILNLHVENTLCAISQDLSIVFEGFVHVNNGPKIWLKLERYESIDQLWEDGMAEKNDFMCVESIEWSFMRATNIPFHFFYSISQCHYCDWIVCTVQRRPKFCVWGDINWYNALRRVLIKIMGDNESNNIAGISIIIAYVWLKWERERDWQRKG